MVRGFLGRGWEFPVGVGPKGRIKTADQDDDIQQSIWIILSTAKGERLMRPDFGCGIHDHVFATIDTTSMGLIDASIREALAQWEPRIELTNVKVSPERAAEGQLLVAIDYRVRSTNNEFNLVYPFYMTEGR